MAHLNSVPFDMPTNGTPRTGIGMIPGHPAPSMRATLKPGFFPFSRDVVFPGRIKIQAFSCLGQEGLEDPLLSFGSLLGFLANETPHPRCLPSKQDQAHQVSIGLSEL
jgi:hypothetical protein